jgi:O-antigen/teichoic acid export membrane protein
MNSNFKRVFKNGFFLFSSYGLSYLLAFFLLFLIINQYSYVEFGRYSLFFSIHLFVLNLLDFGQGEFLVRHLNQNKKSNYVNTSFTYRIIISFIIILLFMVSSFFFKNHLSQFELLTLGLSFFIDNIILFIFYLYRSKQDMRLEAISIVVQKIITILLSLLFIFF